jgi:hypothetical protein
MDPATIKLISTRIYKQFPEVNGKLPKVRLQQPGQSGPTASPAPRIYLLTYQATVSGPGGAKLTRWVRVTSDGLGRIIKISTSR